MHDGVQLLTYVCDTGIGVQHLGVSALLPSRGAHGPPSSHGGDGIGPLSHLSGTCFAFLHDRYNLLRDCCVSSPK